MNKQTVYAAAQYQQNIQRPRNIATSFMFIFVIFLYVGLGIVRHVGTIIGEMLAKDELHDLNQGVGSQ